MGNQIDLSLHKYKYRNITISGLAGTGSTTLLNMLKEHLKFDGWTGFSGGEFMRTYALEKGLLNGSEHHDSSIYNEEFDRKIDYGMREKLTNESKWILESWLSGFMAQKIPNTLKILVYCGSDAVRIDRLVNRDQVSVEVAKANIIKRAKNNQKRWSKMYKDEWQEWVVDQGKIGQDEPINFWDPRLYDLIIDSYKFNQKQVFQKAVDFLNK
jgi:cytidylate kinase